MTRDAQATPEALDLASLQDGLLPLPRAEKKRLLQADVDMSLYNATRKEMETRGLSMRQVVAWALKAFLVEAQKEEPRDNQRT